MIHPSFVTKMLLVMSLGLVASCSLVFSPFPTKVKATTLLGNPDPITRSCPNGFNRTLPNYCHAIVPASVTLTKSGACLSISTGFPLTTTFGEMNLLYQIKSQNAIAYRSAVIQFYTDNICSVGALYVQYTVGSREFAAVAANNLLQEAYVGNFPLQMRTSGAFNLIYYKATPTNCTNCVFVLYLSGFYD